MHKIKHIYIVRILERMAEIMEEDKVTIKVEISTVENICTVYVAEEDVKEESTENQGMFFNFNTLNLLPCSKASKG